MSSDVRVKNALQLRLLRPVLALAGAFMVIIAVMTLKAGIDDYSRLSRLDTEGRTVTATVTNVEQESNRASGPGVANTDSVVSYMASVRYEVDGHSIAPAQRFAIESAEAESFRFGKTLTMQVIVLPDSPSFPYRRGTVQGDGVVAFGLPLLAMAGGVLCFVVAFLLRPIRRS